jgi:hypothetical protein
MLGPIRELSWESISEAQSSKEKPSSIKNPTWSEVESQINFLARAHSGSVFLRAANGSTLSIGGDRGNGYVVFISCHETHQILLAPASERRGVVSLVIGFQPGEYPRRIVVDLDASLKVALAFFNTSRADESEEWTTDGKTVEV